MRFPAAVLGLVLVASTLAACGPNDGTPAPSGNVVAATATPAAPGASGAVTFSDIPRIVAAVEPSVVSVLRPDAEGSGVIWSADGIIVTNHHVVEGVSDVTIAFADGERSPARVLSSDPLSDLAVVRADRKDLPPATFADAVPPIGSLAIALGNPLGFENTATAGIVSGVHRAIPGAAQQAPALVDLVQTDAAISPGNSGGALVGADGTVIGINVAFIPPQARAVSIGFAIPSTTVTSVVQQLLADGHVEHAVLGVDALTLTPQIAQGLGVQRDTGAIVRAVLRNGPADLAGIEPGDIIVAVDDQPTNTVEDLLSALRQHAPGDRITVRIARAGQERTVEVLLGTLEQ